VPVTIHRPPTTGARAQGLTVFDKSSQKCSNIVTPLIRMRPPPADTPLRIARVCLGLLALALVACRTPAPIPPANLDEPGWDIRSGQAVWLPSRQGTELAGELFVARHPDGQTLIEFSKTPIPIIVVQLTPEAWQLRFVSAGRRHSGFNPPPNRSAWLVLPDCLDQRPPPPGWSYAVDPDRNWTLENIHTGERLRGYLLP
jgi:hypothetical protein